MTFKQGLIDTLKSELATFGEDATFRNYSIKVIRGTSSQTKSMRVAGFFNEESFDVIMCHPSEFISNADSPRVNELIEIDGTDYRIREIEVLELSHGFKMIVEKIQ